MSNWPKMTPYQRNTLRKFADSTHGDLHCSGEMLTLWRLRAEGMIEGGSNNWWSITPRGRDYIRALRQREKRLRERGGR